MRGVRTVQRPGEWEPTGLFVLSEFVVADAEPGELEQRIIDVCARSAEVIGTDEPVLVLVEGGDALEVELSHLFERREVGTEHAVQIVTLLVWRGEPAADDHSVVDQLPPR